MANRTIEKVDIDGKKLMEIIKKRGYTLRQLAEEPEINRNDRTIRNSINEGRIQPDLLLHIAYILGIRQEEVIIRDKYDDKQSKARVKVHYSSYFRSLLYMFGVDTAEYYALTETERYNLQKELFAAIYPVILKHFPSEQGSEREWSISEMEDFIDEYGGAFEPEKIREQDEAIERGYIEYMKENPPQDDEDIFFKQYGKHMTDFD